MCSLIVIFKSFIEFYSFFCIFTFRLLRKNIDNKVVANSLNKYLEWLINYDFKQKVLLLKPRLVRGFFILKGFLLLQLLFA